MEDVHVAFKHDEVATPGANPDVARGVVLYSRREEDPGRADGKSRYWTRK